MNKSNIYSIIAYSVMFTGLAVSNILSVLGMHDPNPVFVIDDIFFAIISAVIFCLIMIGSMTALSIKKVVNGIYYKENSSRVGMKIVSYILIIYSYMLGAVTMILYHVSDKQENVKSISNLNSGIINPIVQSILISVFVIIFLYMLSIRVERKTR